MKTFIKMTFSKKGENVEPRKMIKVCTTIKLNKESNNSYITLLA